MPNRSLDFIVLRRGTAASRYLRRFPLRCMCCAGSKYEHETVAME